ncbi:hypothetical protein AZE42_11158, partial [Rhizopogon vesiculosus]
QPIIAPSIPLAGPLLVGTATGLIYLYDVTSHRLLRTISTYNAISISHFATMLKVPDLMRHISLSQSRKFLRYKGCHSQSPRVFRSPGAMGALEPSSASGAKLEAEIHNLRERHGKAKGTNDVMWKTVVQKVMAQEYLRMAAIATGLIHLDDIASHQLLRTISSHKNMSISHLATMLKTPDVIGNISPSRDSPMQKDVIPVRPVVPFHRMKDAKEGRRVKS